MQKAALRKRMRAELECSPSDAILERNVTHDPEFLDAQNILCYMSFGAEVPTHGIIRTAWDMGKTVAIPRCESAPRRIDWHVIHSFDGLVTNAFGIAEPAPHKSTLLDFGCTQSCIAIVPGLLFDERGYRLGYGGGYYDRFLSSFDGCTIGVCRESHLCKSLERMGVIEPHDIPVDIVVTEKRVLHTKHCTKWQQAYQSN